MKRTFNNRGQATLEYTMVIICIIAALLAMQYYIKRSIQGRVRQSADTIGEQYSPGNMDSQVTVTQTGSTTVKGEAIPDPSDSSKFGLQTTSVTDETETRTGHENVGKFENQLFK